MPKYRITAPDGGTYEITAPDGASQDQMLAFAQSQFGSKSHAASAQNVTAPSNGVAMGLRDAVDAGAQMLRRAVPDSVGTAVDNFGNWLARKGLPVTPSKGVEGVDAIVNGVNEKYDAQRRADARSTAANGEQPEPGFDWQRLAGNMIQPANYVGGGAVAAARTVPQLALAGAKAGAASAALQPVVGDTGDFWSSKLGQAATGAVTGAVATPVIARGAEAAAKGIKGAVETVNRITTPDGVRVRVNNVLSSQGLSPADVPKEIIDSVQRQVSEALQQGNKIDPGAIVRRAQFEAVGLTNDAAPTLGQLTRDPMQFSNEKNLSGVRIKTPQGEGNPLADRFQAQNNRLQEVFNLVGAKDATDRVTAGQTIMGALRQADAPVKQGVDDAYTAARAMSGGRMADLDRAAFSQSVNKTLDEQMLGAYLPNEVRNMLNEITAGQKVLGHHGPIVDVPFNVQVAEQWDSVLSAAQRKAGQGTPEALAIGTVRKALHDTPFMPAAPQTGESAAAAAARTVNDPGAPIVDVPFRPAGGPQKALPAPEGGAMSFNIPQPGPAAAVDEGQAAREAFAQARAAARQRFATIENTPALQAALDEAAPDKFVQQFIINGNVGDLQSMRKVLANSPEALAQARAQVAEYLKNSAFGVNVSGDKAFAADRYVQTMRAIGPEKLKVFFSPAEIVRLNLAGKVASDINSIPAGARYATNTSGTGAAVMNLLSKISESPMLRRVPFGRSLANQVGEIQTEQAIQKALTAPAEKQTRELSPEALRALHLLFTPAGVAGGVLAGSAVNP